ncbi:MAG TPA: hypothetical protein PJ988_16760, partial [Anaerolinea sp.]|nr:hypothetical protein [Anaerolinea sp.]
MNDTLAGLNDAFLSLYRENILPVFRFHLARCGDWQEAQALTHETFRRAQPWFSRRVSASGQELAWLFGIAVWVQSHIRRKVDVGDAIGDDMRPLQEQVAAFVTVSEISETWSRLPVRTADALALFIFAGLDLDVVAQIVGWSALDIRTRLSRLVDQQTDQRLLASSLQPVGYFAGRLENELREMPQSRATARRRGAGPAFWRFSYVSSQAMGAAGRGIPLVFFVVLLLGAVWAITNPQFQRPAVIPTPTVPPNISADQFPWTDDAAILADEQGRVFRMQLFDQQKIYLSMKEGLYLPSGRDAVYEPQISPDGHWLELVNSLDRSTVLLSFQGDDRRVVSSSSVELSWARAS